MATDTYAALQNAIVRWARRTGDMEFSDTVPDFIRMCESKINMRLRLAEQEATATLAPVDGVCDLPANYIAWRSVRVGDATLSQISPEQTDGFRTAGTPRHFSIVGDDLLLWPPGAGDVTLGYYAKVPALTTSAPSNWLLTKAPQVYIYGSLIEAAPFTGEDARMGLWVQSFEQSIMDLIKADEKARYFSPVIRAMGAAP
jgi:hypothetical protein